MLRSTLPGLLALGLVLSSSPASAQVAASDWTPRPDAFAPAGVHADRLFPSGAVDARVQLRHHSYRDLLSGRSEISPLVVLQDWDYVPLQAERQEAIFELGYGLTSWLSLLGRLPMVRAETSLMNSDQVSTTSTTGLGDVEIHAMAGLHDRWPVRAHLSAGVSVPTGTWDHRGVMVQGAEAPLPYLLQSGAGTLAFLPGATLVTENAYGTVGFQAQGRVYFEENDRDWHPGNALAANVFMQYRFNDWMGGSVRLAYTRQSGISGLDESLDPFVSPLHFALASGGTRLQVPVGVNVYFADGALQGNRLQAELLVPAHSQLNGPQLRESWGVTFSWGYSFGGDQARGTRFARTAAPSQREAIVRAPAPERAEPSETETRTGNPVDLCIATGETVRVYLTAAGDTLVGPDRVTFQEAGGAGVVFPGSYAEGETWFVQDEPIPFEEREHLKSGGETGVDCENLAQIGAHRGVPLFVTRGSTAPHDPLFVPVRPGVWQLYRADLPQVRG